MPTNFNNTCPSYQITNIPYAHHYNPLLIWNRYLKLKVKYNQKKKKIGSTNFRKILEKNWYIDIFVELKNCSIGKKDLCLKVHT